MKKLFVLLLIMGLLAACGGGGGGGGGDPYIGTWNLVEFNGHPAGGETMRITSSSTGTYSIAGITTSFTYTRTGNTVTFTYPGGAVYIMTVYIDAQDRLHLVGNGEAIFVRG